MTLDDTDCDLLELLTLEVPWYMVGGEFHAAYGGVERLAGRLEELVHAELVRIHDREAPGVAPPIVELVSDALANGCYERIEENLDPRWMLVATDAGFALIEERLGRQ